MSKVAIVTDSTVNFPQGLVNGYPIHIVPLHIIWGNDNLLDGVDITPEAFYQRLQSEKTIPTTSQPSPGDFIQIFSSLLNAGHDVLCITISSSLSGTMSSALQAKQALNYPANLEIVDSNLTAMPMGFPIMLAARAAMEGATLQECKFIAEQHLARSGVLFVVPSLEFLHKGGRIGSAAAFFGTALDMKPILELRGGRIEAIERVRSINKALDRVVDLIGDRTKPYKAPFYLCALHANAPEEAQKLLDRARALFSIDEVNMAVVSEISPVIGTHTGPGVLSIGFTCGA